MGRTVANGYGKAHKRLRAAYLQRMANGETFHCWRCLLPINPAVPWDLGHDDFDRTRYHGPEHVSCNRRAKRRRYRQNFLPAPRRWML